MGYPDGQPLGGVTLMVVDDTGRPFLGSVEAGGLWEVSGLPTGRYRVRAVPDHALNRIGSWWGDAWSFCAADVVALTLEEARDDLLHELPEGGWLEGLVLDGDGLPLVGARVRATGLDFYNSVTTREAETDDEGHYVLSGLDSVTLDGEPVPGHYRASAAAAAGARWYAPGTWAIAEAEPVEVHRGEVIPLDFTLPRGTSLSGWINDSSGQAIPNASVALRARDGGLLFSTSASEEGQFLFEAVSGSDFELSASAPGFATVPLTDGVQAQPGQLIDVGSYSLPPESTLSGALVGMDLLSGSSLLLVDVDEGGQQASLPLEPGQGTFAFEGLPEGTYQVELRSASESLLLSGLLATSSGGAAQVSLGVGEAAALDVQLSLGGALTGSVRRRGGDPLARALVSVTDLAGAPLPGAEVRSDAEGRFVLRGLPAGEVLLQAAYEPFCGDDPTWVTRHWPAGRRLEEAIPVTVLEGLALELEELLLAPDGDGDGMDDLWELAWGLEPERPDGHEDPDLDGLTNLQEYQQRSDPLGSGGDVSCSDAGCGDRSGGLPGGAALASILLLGRRRRSAPRTLLRLGSAKSQGIR